LISPIIELPSPLGRGAGGEGDTSGGQGWREIQGERGVWYPEGYL